MATINNPNWDDIAEKVSAGKASTILSVGDLLLYRYLVSPGSLTTKGELYLRVLGFDDAIVKIDGQDITAHSIQMEPVQMYSVQTEWAKANHTPYSNSVVRRGINDRWFLKALSNDIKNYIGFTKVQTVNQDGSVDVCYDKIFTPSAVQLGIQSSTYATITQQQRQVEGPTFTYYINANKSKREKYSWRLEIDYSDPIAYWTRTQSMNLDWYDYNQYCIYVDISGDSKYAEFVTDSFAPSGVAFNFIGNGPVSPKSKLYSSYQNKSKLTGKLYASRNNQSKSVSKLYGSENGQSRQIF